MQTYAAKEEMQRKNFYLSVDLADRAEKVAKAFQLNLSEFVRAALEDYIARTEAERIEKEIMEACASYYEIDKEMAARWVSVESDVK